MRAIAIHGFLGQPTDWDFLNISGFDLFAGPILPFWEWATHFNQHAEGDILIGYSLGGRLAMHALIQNPERWKGAVIISAHPGLKSAEAREQKLGQTLAWKRRFLTEPWAQLMEGWNSQPLFQGAAFPRKESDFSRYILGEALDIWSLGRQDNLREQLAKLNLPILWVAGREDVAYASIANEMEFAHPQSIIWVVEGASHRVPWEALEQFSGRVAAFLQETVIFQRFFAKNELLEKCPG